MKKNPAEEGIRHLRRIEGELSDIKENTGGWRNWFLRGALQGAGFLVGTIAALVLVGWILSILGIVPGFDEVAEYLRSAIDRARL